MPIAIVSGALANKPLNGGNAWSRLSWLKGLEQLGFEVLFVELVSSKRVAEADGSSTGFFNSPEARYFREVMHWAGYANASALLDIESGVSEGLSLKQVVAQAGRADLLINLSGHLDHPAIHFPAACRIYLDDDPGYTQIWSVSGSDAARLSGHDYYYTFGANLGRANCPIPTAGRVWGVTRPPVTLEDWPAMDPGLGRFSRFTTVASWRGAYAAIEFAGHRYGQKAHEFRKVLNLPGRVSARCEIALQIHPGDDRDRESLLAHGWVLRDPVSVAGTPDAFRRFVQESDAEFSVAQGIYVDTRSGWFSDRTVRYLASGRPAVVQDTGLTGHLPLGEGLLTFRSLEEAVEQNHRLSCDYPHHCRVARQIAEEFFDSNRVLRQLLGEVGVRHA